MSYLGLNHNKPKDTWKRTGIECRLHGRVMTNKTGKSTNEKREKKKKKSAALQTGMLDASMVSSMSFCDKKTHKQRERNWSGTKTRIVSDAVSPS